MTRPANYAAMALSLQSGSSIRSIEFKDGGYFCGGDEVTGRKYIVDFRKLHFGRIARDESGTITIHEGRCLWDCSPDDLKSVTANDVGTRDVSERTGDTRGEQALILVVEDLESGALVHLVLHGPDGRAAIGRLCNLYRRHPGNGDAIVKLNISKQRRTTGLPITVPELSLENWEAFYRRAPNVDDDDIPF